MTITPLILGSGSSGHAIASSFATLKVRHPQLKLALPVQLMRGSSLLDERRKYAHPILCISNPHGLHAETLLQAELAGFPAAICEKPACVNLHEVKALRNLKMPTAVLHVYRQTWGLQTLRKMSIEGQFGEMISIEGRYWQASAAERALKSGDPARGWKDQIPLSGEYDVYLDIATHWLDAASFLFGSVPKRIQGWRSYVNAVSPHRDSHVQVSADYSKGQRAFASISKTVHGATNHFEINVIGSKKSATWKFLEPDVISVGEGRDLRVMARTDSSLGSGQAPFHAQGWLEGYIEIAHGLVTDVFHSKKTAYPNLSENLDLLESMFQTQWS